MLYINTNLSKNQLHKPKNQIKKIHNIIKQDNIEFFGKYFFILQSSIYFRVIIMVGF